MNCIFVYFYLFIYLFIYDLFSSIIYACTFSIHFIKLNHIEPLIACLSGAFSLRLFIVHYYIKNVSTLNLVVVLI